MTFSPRLGLKPPYIKGGTHTRIQRKGILYEKKVARALVEWASSDDLILHGQWIYWGGAVCQPDLLLIPPRGPILIIEVKLTHKKNAEKKLREVYGPAVDRIFAGRGIAYAQIFKNLNGNKPHSYDFDHLRTLTAYQYGEILWR